MRIFKYQIPKINNNDSSKSQKCQILNYPMYLSHNNMALNTQVYIIILLSFKAVPKLEELIITLIKLKVKYD